MLRRLLLSGIILTEREPRFLMKMSSSVTKHPAPSLWEKDQTPSAKDKLIQKSREEPFVPIGE